MSRYLGKHRLNESTPNDRYVSYTILIENFSFSFENFQRILRILRVFYALAKMVHNLNIQNKMGKKPLRYGIGRHFTGHFY